MLLWRYSSGMNSVRLHFRGESTDTLSVTLDGRTETASVDTSVLDGCVKVDFTNLEPKRKYSFTASLGVDAVSGTVKTLPGLNDSVKMAYVSCINPNHPAAILRVLMNREPDLVFLLGDTPYMIDRDWETS